MTHGGVLKDEADGAGHAARLECRPDSAGTRGDSRRYSVAAVERALDLLEALAGIGPAPLADVARTAGCTRTAAFRLLRTLEARGFAIQDSARGAWRLGARWGGLGSAASAQGALAAAAGSAMAALGAACGETVYLRVRDGLEGETIALFRPEPSQRLYFEIGHRRLLHAGSGRLLLAYAPEPVRRQMLSLKLPRFTPSTRVEIDWIAADLRRIRTRGFLLTTDEVELGAVAIAAPVRDATGQVIAALVVAAPSLRLRLPRARALVPMIQAAAADLSAALGASERNVEIDASSFSGERDLARRSD
jgi:DNA-binding IclR family transcriptional regulator